MQNIINKIKNMDKKIIKIVDIGLWISFLVSMMGVVLLLIHYKVYISAELYYIGIEVFKMGLIGAVSLIVCSCGLWLVKEQMK
jgi:vacuolar-type H+-ATPase subunit I/STV1